MQQLHLSCFDEEGAGALSYRQLTHHIGGQAVFRP